MYSYRSPYEKIERYIFFYLKMDYLFTTLNVSTLDPVPKTSTFYCTDKIWQSLHYVLVR